MHTSTESTGPHFAVFSHGPHFTPPAGKGVCVCVCVCVCVRLPIQLKWDHPGPCI